MERSFLVGNRKKCLLFEAGMWIVMQIRIWIYTDPDPESDADPDPWGKKLHESKKIILG